MGHGKTMESQTLTFAPSSGSSPNCRPYGTERVGSLGCCRSMAPKSPFWDFLPFPRHMTGLRTLVRFGLVYATNKCQNGKTARPEIFSENEEIAVRVA